MLRAPCSTLTSSVVFLAFALLASANPAHATDPEEFCNEHDALVSQLMGKPHYERQALLLADELPSQRHRLELFMNAGEGGRHTYSLLRTRRGGSKACIVSAGLVEKHDRDRYGHNHLTLNDENDPDSFEFVVCDGQYVIYRKTADTKIAPSVDVCANVKALTLSPRLVVSYGTIAEDHRADIPWPR